MRRMPRRPALPALPPPATVRPPSAAARRQATRIGRALAHIESHLDGPLDAPSLADHAALSRHHFHRLFQAQVGLSVARYVTWRRLQRACALLVSGSEPVLQVALAVGFESGQALAKAMRRELDASPSALRRGHTRPWAMLLHPDRLTDTLTPGAPTMHPTPWATQPTHPTLMALTATARGMVERTLVRAAQQAFGELRQAVIGAGALDQVRSVISLCPDDPLGPDDPHCRYVAGYVFGHDLATLQGDGCQPPVPLSGSLAWWPIAGGRYAVFSHLGPYNTLHRSWTAIYRDWLPASGEQLRDVPPLELCITLPDSVPAEQLHTEIWIPVR